MKFAKNLGIPLTDKGVHAILDNPSICDVVLDCTSAHAHIEHWELLKDLNLTVIDMTPAKIGTMCIPVLNGDDITTNDIKNINMVTCGGQASIPIASAISSIHSNIDYIEVASNIASLSAGPATRYNLDEYVETTEYALQQATSAKKTKAILILNPANPCIDMQTAIYAKIKNPDINAITNAVVAMVEKLKEYVPGYRLIVPPTIVGENVVTTIKVIGAGHYLPAYAGNLDIINCAAIAVLEKIVKARNE
jgi:acetaldehyde dehydrogenase